MSLLLSKVHFNRLKSTKTGYFLLYNNYLFVFNMPSFLNGNNRHQSKRSVALCGFCFRWFFNNGMTALLHIWGGKNHVVTQVDWKGALAESMRGKWMCDALETVWLELSRSCWMHGFWMISSFSNRRWAKSLT